MFSLLEQVKHHLSNAFTSHAFSIFFQLTEALSVKFADGPSEFRSHRHVRDSDDAQSTIRTLCGKGPSKSLTFPLLCSRKSLNFLRGMPLAKSDTDTRNKMVETI